MNLFKYFKGWNSLNLNEKAQLLSNFIREHSEEIGHDELDNICIKLFEQFHEENIE